MAEWVREGGVGEEIFVQCCFLLFRAALGEGFDDAGDFLDCIDETL
jgi:hypothetical protein